MVLQKKYSQSAETAVASYNYTDVAEGTGTIIFYGLRDNISGAETFRLTTDQGYSSLPETVTTSTGTTTLNFDTQQFNLPRTLKGTAYVSMGMYNTTADGCRINVKLQKISGITTTDISSVVYGSPILTNTGATTGCIMNFLPLSLTQTNIKKGDYIRLVLNFQRNEANNCAIGHDPQGFGAYIVASRFATTIMKVYLPFRLDL